MCVCVTPLYCVAVLQPRSAAAGGKSREDTINEIVDSIKTRLPGEYDVEAVSMQYPVKYEDSMNTVLVQVR
jgi:dynein heavy chain